MHLPCKHWYLHLISKIYIKISGLVAHACDQKAGETETRESLEPHDLFGDVQAMRDPVSKMWVAFLRTASQVGLQPPQMHVCIHLHTQKHMHACMHMQILKGNIHPSHFVSGYILLSYFTDKWENMLKS